jgi:hypothetical protein
MDEERVLTACVMSYKPAVVARILDAIANHSLRSLPMFACQTDCVMTAEEWIKTLVRSLDLDPQGCEEQKLNNHLATNESKYSELCEIDLCDGLCDGVRA